MRVRTIGGRPDIQAFVHKGMSFDPTQRGTARGMLENAFATHTSIVKQRSREASMNEKLDEVLRNQGELKQMLSVVLTNTTRTLNVTLALAKNEVSIPSLFMILPKPKEKSRGFLKSLLKKPDGWFNEELVVVFICAKTMRAATYDGDSGLSFRVPNDLARGAMGFWARYGPVREQKAAATWLFFFVFLRVCILHLRACFSSLCNSKTRLLAVDQLPSRFLTECITWYY